MTLHAAWTRGARRGRPLCGGTGPATAAWRRATCEACVREMARLQRKRPVQLPPVFRGPAPAELAATHRIPVNRAALAILSFRKRKRRREPDGP